MVDYNFEVSPALTGMVIGYQNPTFNLVADKVMPRVPVNGELFKWKEYPKNAFLRIPDTDVGREGIPKGLGLKFEKKTAEIDHYATMEKVPLSDVAAATDGDDPVKDHTILATNSLILDRERRVAGIMQNPDNFGHKETLSSSDQFDNPDSKLTEIMADIRNSMLVKPNCGIVSDSGLAALQRHPDIVASYNGSINSNNRGEAPIEAVMRFLKLKELLIGELFLDFAKEGSTPDIRNIWGNNLILFFKNPQAKPNNGELTFGLTAEFEQRKILTFDDPTPGVDGVKYIKAAEKVKELVIASSCGYLIQNITSEKA